VARPNPHQARESRSQTHRHHERHEAHERHERHGGHDERSCGSCDPCATDDCGCRCCITDADLAVYTRLGEHRIVPIVVKNHWRRERDIRLSLQGWATSGGRRSPTVTSRLDATEFTLGPCSERQVVLSIDTAQVKSRDGGSTIPTPVPAGPGPVGRAGKREPEAAEGSTPKPESTEGHVDTRGGNADGNDVDQCTVLYADLTIEGCDTRPVRIALAILPRTCGAYELTCRSGCC
jgi:hypothetical protein